MNPQTHQPEDARNNTRKIAATNGLIWAAINIVIFLFTYYARPQLFGNMSYGIVTFLLGLALSIYFILDVRKKIGGYWSFRVALSHIFVLFFVQYVAFYLFTVGFPRFIEPGYTDVIRDIRLNSITEIAETFGAGDQDQIDQVIEQAEAALENELNPTFSFILQTMAMSVIMYFIGALIFAAIFKRERPVFAPVAADETDPEQ